LNPAERFLALTPERRALAFADAGAQRGVSEVILEKDFWVCWLLGVLFADVEVAPHLVFKGGTSLAKVFGAIDRFSEDVDLSVSPAFVGADAGAFEALASRTKRGVAFAEMQRLCVEKVRDVIAPRLETTILGFLGPPRASGSWLTLEHDAQSNSPILLLSYPASDTKRLSYIRRSVKLELGSLTDQQPVGRYPVRPWVADAFPSLLADWRCEVIALDLPRSFWEKATILHEVFYRPENQPTPDRYARHYADVARLLKHGTAATFLADKTMCARIADWKGRVYAKTSARYDLARHGTLRLAPPAHRLEALKADYEAMRPMFLQDPPPFAEVVQDLQAAEETINSM
jgi:hypothetical protein